MLFLLPFIDFFSGLQISFGVISFYLISMTAMTSYCLFDCLLRDQFNTFNDFDVNAQLKIALNSPAGAAQLREINLGRCPSCQVACRPRLETLVITSWDRRRIAGAMEPLSLVLKPSIKYLRELISNMYTFPRDDTETVTKQNILLLENPSNPKTTEATIAAAIAIIFPTITELQFFSTTPAQYCVLVRLLQNREFAGRLTSLTIYYFLPGCSKQEEEAVVKPFFDAINNNMPLLRKLALIWESAHLVLPDLPILAQLQVMALHLGKQHTTKDDPEPVVQPEFAPEKGGGEEGAPETCRVQVHLQQGPPNPPDLAHFLRSLERYAAANTATLEVHLISNRVAPRASPVNLLRLAPALRRCIVRIGMCFEHSLGDTIAQRTGRYYVRCHDLSLQQELAPLLLLRSVMLPNTSTFTSLRSISMGAIEDVDGFGRLSKSSLGDVFFALRRLAPQLTHLELSVFVSSTGRANNLLSHGEEAEAHSPPTILPKVRALDLNLYHLSRGPVHRMTVMLGRQLQWALPALETLHLQEYYCQSCLERSSGRGLLSASQCLQATLIALFPGGVLVKEDHEGQIPPPIPGRRPRLLLDCPLEQFSFEHMKELLARAH